MSDTRKYHVVMTWEDWPSGGSYATVVDTPYGEEDAERLARLEMAESRGEEIGQNGDDITETYGHAWHLVSFEPLDLMIPSLLM